MILRYLARKSKAWSARISECIKSRLQALSKDDAEWQFSRAVCESWLFGLFGALGVFGGHVDPVRVGTKCYYVPENRMVTVTSRSFSKTRVSLIRDSEQTHIDKVSLNDVVCTGDEVF